MLIRHIFTGFSAFFVVGAAMAAEVRLGSERALDPELEIGPAAFHQESPSVASNGRDFLAVWIDRRATFFDAPIFASRLGADGRPLEPLGRRLATGASYPHVASAGGDYLVAWHDAAGSNVLRVDEDGRPIGDVRRLNTTRAPRDIVSNGSTYLLLEAGRHAFGMPPLTATILDRDGAPVHTFDKTYGRLVWAGAYDRRYVVIAADTRCDPGCQEVPTLHTIEETSSGWRETSRVFLPYIPDPTVYLAAVASRDRILVTSHTHAPGSVGSYMVFDYSGNIVRERMALPGHVSESGAAWDGSEFLLLFRKDGVMSALRLEPDGRMLGDPFAVSMTRPDIASNGSTQLFVWAQADVLSRAVDNFAMLANAPEERTLVSYSGAAQFDVQIASSGAGLVAVWIDSNNALRGAINGTSFSIVPKAADSLNSPSVAAGAKNFLVVWQESDSVEWKLFAKRVAFDGTVLDAEPLILASGKPFGLPDNPGIAYDGSSFFVVFAMRNLYYARVTDDGIIVDRRVELHDARSPDPVWTGDAFLVPHTALAGSPQLCDICIPEWHVALDRVTLFPRAGQGEGMKLAAAMGLRRVTLAWMSFDPPQGPEPIVVAQITSVGKVVLTPTRVVEIPYTSADTISLAWNGSEYVLAWSDSSGMIRAMRLTETAVPIDDAPFDVAMQSRGSRSRFTLTPTAAGVAFGYDRIDEASGFVSRAFTRTLERLTRSPVRRAVRH